MKQNILSKKTVFQAKLFKINELEIEIKPNITRIHHSIERDPVVYVFPLTENKEVYLVKQYRYNLEKDVLEGVAGYIEKNELPLEAAKRELQEETGILADKWTELPNMKLGAGVIHGHLHFFVAQELHFGSTHFDEGEDIELIKMPLSEALEKVVKGDIMIAPSALGILLTDTLSKQGQL